MAWVVFVAGCAGSQGPATVEVTGLVTQNGKAVEGANVIFHPENDAANVLASQAVTDADGRFRYRSGETVSFRVGDILLGQAPGAPTVTPFDLAGATPPIAAVDVRREWNRLVRLPRTTPLGVAVNIATLLQTLDEDGDPSNGIRIPAAIHGLAAGVVCYMSSVWLKRALGYDDSLDAFGVHGVGGALGAVLTGVFASSAINSLGSGALLDGNWGQVGKQLIGVLATFVYCGIGTFVLLKIVDVVVGLRVTREVEVEGLDINLHGETVHS